MPRNHRLYQEEWIDCTTCGRCFPRSQIARNRWGWQCLPGNFRGYSCWDGNIQPGDIRYIPRPGEGTRQVSGPSCPTTDGVEDGDDRLRLRDRVLPVTYELIFGAFFQYQAVDAPPYGVPAILLNGGWYLYISDGFMAYTRIPIVGAYGNAETDNHFFMDATNESASLIYTP